MKKKLAVAFGWGFAFGAVAMALFAVYLIERISPTKDPPAVMPLIYFDEY